jgi:hypothetical protein
MFLGCTQLLIMISKLQEKIMNELIAFFKDIFMINDESANVQAGLCQFNHEQKVQQKPKVEKINKEVKLSDLMRKSA